MLWKKTAESETPADAEAQAPAETTESEEVRERIIAEYLASVKENRPKAKIVEGGAAPAAPVRSPKTLGEAAAYVREMMNKQKGE